MNRVAEFYGFEPNRAGFIKCPFHADKTASIKIYPGMRGFHCFGCHEGGSVVDFVMKLFGLSFKDACARLNEDFRLGLDLAAPLDKTAVRQFRAAQDKKEQRYEKFLGLHRRKTDEYRRLHQVRIDKAPKPDDEEWDKEFCEAVRRLLELEDWFDRAQDYEIKLLKNSR